MPHRLTLRRWVVASLWHYRRTNLALVLGVIVGTAVIGGALIVGDSVRASLRQMTLDRLGQIDYVLTGPRFFREELAADVQQPPRDGSSTQAPAIVMRGSLERKSGVVARRASQVHIFGVDRRAWDLMRPGSDRHEEGTSPPFSNPPSGTGAFLNEPLARALQAQPGDEVTIWIELPSSVPRDTLLGQRDDDTKEVTVTVAAILPDGPGAPRLGLNPTQQLPLNVFVDLHALQEALNLEAITPSRRDPLGRPARVNTLFAAQPLRSGSTNSAADTDSDLAAQLRQFWTLADLQLRIVHDTTLNVLSLESEQMLLEDRFAQAALDYAKKEHVPASPVSVYLANWIRNARDASKYSMYSTVAGLDILDLDDVFGPWEFVGSMPDSLGEYDVIINEFLAEDLKVQVGDEIRFGYHVVGAHGELPEEELTVTVRGIVKMAGAAEDKQLAPEVKGITDVESLAEWDQPFPMQLDKVTPRDDDYWAMYRATPKLFLPLATARKLWPSRYGTLTSVRVALKPGQSVAAATAELERFLLSSIDPHDVGLVFEPVKQNGLRAANGATDFTGLFLGFSFFLILSAVILVGLLFRLTIDQRVQQWGLLTALGLPPRMIRRMMLGEALAVVLVGSVVGCFAAVGYAQLMVYGLKTWWIGAIGTKFLFLSVHSVSVAMGAIVSAVASLLAMLGGVWQLRGVSPRAQLQGVSEPPPRGGSTARQAARRAAASVAIAVLLLLGVRAGVIPAGEAFSGLAWPIVVFFVAGLLLLAAGLWSFSAWLQRDRTQGIATPTFRGQRALLDLGLRNAARRRQRSLLSTGLIAAATFVITAVAAGHKDPSVERPEKYSGNGGFTLVAEASRPILHNLNTPDGRKQLNLQPRTPEQSAALAAMRVMAFRMKPGEDASCLNLFQTRAPTILGVPNALIERGGFKIIGGGDATWQKLHGGTLDVTAGIPMHGDTVPVLGDMNTLMFGLKKGVGDRLAYPAEDASFKAWLEVVGMFDGSVFQGVLLMSEANFLQLFPEQQGFQYFLIEVPLEHAAAASELLETELSEYGLDVEPVADRLARFLAVQNTYLSTFQTLGGLGLLLGTFGLATVMLRNVWERQAELALLRAVGFLPRQIAALVLTENAWLLMWGLATGAISALVAMTPHLSSTGADVPWRWVGGLLAAVFCAGCAAAWGAVRTALQLPMVATLRGE